MLLSARRRQKEATIERLYGAIVAHARLPVFYRRLAVPDTIEGRFDLLVLHVHLVFRRLSGEDAAGRDLGQAIFDRFIADMDASLRELGVGDLAVPKRMRAMGEAFYGRAAAYDSALAEAGDVKLAAALLRNVYGGAESARETSLQLAKYARGTASALGEQNVTAIAAGDVRFPVPDEARR